MTKKDPRIEKKLELYLEKAKPTFDNLEMVVPEGGIDIDRAQREFYEMAMAYYDDAKHFFKEEEYANALAALEYAEGWLDAGRRLGIFRVKKAENIKK